MRFLALLLAALLSFAPVLAAQDVGMYTRSGTASVQNPVAGKTWLADYTTGHLFFFNSDGVWEQRTLPKSNFAASVAPTVSNDSSQGYSAGSLWFDLVGKKEYLCSDAAVGAAVWGQISDLVSTITLPNKLTFGDWLGDYVASGLLGSVPSSSLTMTTPAGVAYVNHLRIAPSGGAYTYTANKDTYDYLQADGSINHVAVNNGAPAPTGQTGLFIQKVVSGSEITSVTQTPETGPAAFIRATKTNLLSNNSNFVNIAVANGLAGNWTYTMPDLGGNASFILANAGSGSAGLPVVATGAGLPSQFAVLDYRGGGLGTSTAPSNGYIPIGNGSGFTLAPLSNSSGKVSISPGVGTLGLDVVESYMNLSSMGGTLVIPTQVTGILTAAKGGTGSGTNPTTGQIGIANGSNVYVPTTMSGDATIASGGALTLSNTAVTPGTYSNPNVTVDSKGRVTNIANGSAAALKWTLNAKSANFSATDTSGTDYQITASSGITITLPTSPADGTVYRFQRISGSGQLTFNTTGGELINQGGITDTSLAIYDGSPLELEAVTGGWQIK